MSPPEKFDSRQALEKPKTTASETRVTSKEKKHEPEKYEAARAASVPVGLDKVSVGGKGSYIPVLSIDTELPQLRYTGGLAGKNRRAKLTDES